MSETSIKLTPNERRVKIKNIIRIIQFIEKIDDIEKEKQGTNPADLASSVVFSIEGIQHIPPIQ